MKQLSGCLVLFPVRLIFFRNLCLPIVGSAATPTRREGLMPFTPTNCKAVKRRLVRLYRLGGPSSCSLPEAYLRTPESLLTVHPCPVDDIPYILAEFDVVLGVWSKKLLTFRA